MVQLFFARWPIKYKLLLCTALLLVIVAILAVSSLHGSYAYRELAKTVSWRSAEFPLVDELTGRIRNLERAVRRHESEIDRIALSPFSAVEFNLREHTFYEGLIKLDDSIRKYRSLIEHDLPQFGTISDRRGDRAILEKMSERLAELKKLQFRSERFIDAEQQQHLDGLATKVDEIEELAQKLREQLYSRMQSLSAEVRVEYQAWIGLSWMSAVAAAVVLVVLLRLFYAWVMNPLQVLIDGSRRIAKSDDFAHRIRLATQDEMAELAESMNAMTARFLTIKTDQEETIRRRTQEVVRSEQLASVGFLAAGVAHEINNPLASIALCAESLESRVHDILSADDSRPAQEQNGEVAILKKYLRRIQEEAFRCKEITGRLLDFSRVGNTRKEATDMTELVQGVIEMVSHLENYRDKRIEFVPGQRVVATVNPQEMKQVVLNLATNALDSVEPGGKVSVTLAKSGPFAELVVRDNGCGMTPEVLKHLFEPFFTRRRDGKGTGLGLSITCRIIHEHGGSIEPASGGPGKGSQMKVLLPLLAAENKNERQIQKRNQAA
ncbi:MAG TPA: ATP-binding protein [Pirellulaceae bacterium]|nr:ATP-binding protein [Pirellulaceae bacterium]